MFLIKYCHDHAFHKTWKNCLNVQKLNALTKNQNVLSESLMQKDRTQSDLLKSPNTILIEKNVIKNQSRETVKPEREHSDDRANDKEDEKKFNQPVDDHSIFSNIKVIRFTMHFTNKFYLIFFEYYRLYIRFSWLNNFLSFALFTR